MFSSFLSSRFGIQLPSHLYVQERSQKVYLAVMELKDINYHRTHRKGMQIGKQDSIYGQKPSLNFVLAFGHLATKNVIGMPHRQIQALYQHQNVPIDPSMAGLIIVQDEQGCGACLGFAREGKLEPLVPK